MKEALLDAIVQGAGLIIGVSIGIWPAIILIVVIANFMPNVKLIKTDELDSLKADAVAYRTGRGGNAKDKAWKESK